jgi:hypothetical protein
MRRVQVESPFASRTPKDETACVHNSPDICRWEQSEGSGVRACGACANRRRVERIRVYESQLHARYLALCLRDCIERGETPYASHAILTLPGVLRDDVPEERVRGIAAGFTMRRGMHTTVIYVDCYVDEWMSKGMAQGAKDAYALQDKRREDIWVGTGAERFQHGLEMRRLRETNPLWVPVEYKAP